MFGIKEIMENIRVKKTLIKEEKFRLINSQLNYGVLEYLTNKFSGLTIEVYGDYKGNIMDLKNNGKLEGFCWQTTDSSIVFLENEDFIERGYLKLSEQEPLYYHSWICFTYEETLYVFDPCLNLLCKKELYDKMFEPKVEGRVTAKKVKEYLIYCIQNPKQEELSPAEKSLKAFFMSLCPECYERQQKETHISGNEDVNSPMYRNCTGYVAEIEEGQIRKLIAHYYNGIN